jgi:hypothetical protein
MGLSPKGFEHIVPHIRDCEYRGIFASAARRRWWVSKLRQKIRTLTNGSTSDPIWRLGRKLLDENFKNEVSVCHGTQTPDCIPDIVAFADGLKRKRVQTRSQFTKPLETDTPPLGFEQLRVYSGN